MRLLEIVNDKVNKEVLQSKAITLWTFGAPNIGNVAWAEAYNQAFEAQGATHWRVTNLDDFLPHMIPEGLVAAPTITDAIASGADPMDTFNLYPLVFDQETGYAHAGQEVQPHACP